MKNIWSKLGSYLAVGFAFFSAGIIFAVKFLSEKTVFKGQVRIKQRGKGNDQMTDIRPQINAKTSKNERKQAKIIKRNEKKALKAVKRLNKIS